MTLLRKYLEAHKTLTERLFDVIDEYDIYNFFFQLAGSSYEDIRINQGILYLSPFRYDRKPTVSLFTNNKNNKIYFKDFGTGITGHIFDFIKLYARHRGTFITTGTEVIRYIDNAIGLDVFTANPISYKSSKTNFTYVKAKRETSILFKSRDFTDNDIEYWKQFNVSIKLLKQYDVRSIQYLLNKQNEVIYEFKPRQLAFAFVILDKVKIYCPEDTKGFKWRSNIPGNDWRYYAGLTYLKYTDTLIITKSMKDLLTFKALSTTKKFDVIAPQSETVLLNAELAEKLKARYKNIIAIYDYDLAGVAMANKLKKKYGFTIKFVSTRRININGKLRCILKDISDYTLMKGIEAGKQKLTDMLP